MADLLATYYTRLQERAHELNGYVNSESGYGSYPHPQMDGLQIFGRSDRPMAEFWHIENIPGRLPWVDKKWADEMRTAASSARIYGHRYVQAETLTYHPVRGVATPPGHYRKTLHAAWARGLNQAVIHKYTHQPYEDKPGEINYDVLNRHFAWWPMADGFLGYMSRSQQLLQEGQFVADAAYFVGEGAWRFVPGKQALKPELPAGCDYDGINAEVLLSRAEARDGRLVLPEGLSYRYLALCDPQCRRMSPMILAKLRQLVEAGVTLVGLRPLGTPGLTDLPHAEAQLKADADALWGENPAAEGQRHVGRGRVIWGRSLAGVMASDGLKPDVEALGLDNKPILLDWIHRRGRGVDIYFLANPFDKPLEVPVTLRTQGRSIRLFEPLDGSVRELPQRTLLADGRTSVPLKFESEQAYFVVIGDEAGEASNAAGRNFPALKALVELAGPWQVTFESAWVKPLPAGVASTAGVLPVVFDQLTDWTQRPEAGIKHYSGMATYRKNFDLQSELRDPKSKIVLDLGVAYDLARVTINGRELGVAWAPPWRVRIPAGLLREKGNELEITVANTWQNRLVADSALPVKERLTVSRHPILFESVKDGLQPAGLLGPVRVVVEQ